MGCKLASAMRTHDCCWVVVVCLDQQRLVDVFDPICSLAWNVRQAV